MELVIPLIKGVIKNFSQIILHSVEAIYKQVVVEVQVCIPYFHPKKTKTDKSYYGMFQVGCNLRTRTISKGRILSLT